MLAVAVIVTAGVTWQRRAPRRRREPELHRGASLCRPERDRRRCTPRRRHRGDAHQRAGEGPRARGGGTDIRLLVSRQGGRPGRDRAKARRRHGARGKRAACGGSHPGHLGARQRGHGAHDVVGDVRPRRGGDLRRAGRRRARGDHGAQGAAAGGADGGPHRKHHARRRGVRPLSQGPVPLEPSQRGRPHEVHRAVRVGDRARFDLRARLGRPRRCLARAGVLEWRRSGRTATRPRRRRARRGDQSAAGRGAFHAGLSADGPGLELERIRQRVSRGPRAQPAVQHRREVVLRPDWR